MKMRFKTVAILLVLSVLFYLSESRRHNKRSRHGALREGSRRGDRWSQLYGRSFVRDRQARRQRHGRRNGFRWGYRWFDRHSPMFFRVDFGSSAESEGWWRGPNVCETVTEDESNSTSPEISHHYSYQSATCDVTESAYKCTQELTENGQTKKKTTVKECCAGFSRKEGENGCPREVSMKTIVDTLKDMGLTKFLRAIESMGMTDQINEQEFTVFAPTNDVMENFDDFSNVPEVRLQDAPTVLLISKPIKEKILTGMEDTILRHVIPGTFRSSAMEDEQLIETSSADKSKIRINYYAVPEKASLMTANCIEVLRQDKLATNGVVHEIAEMVEPVIGSLVDLIGKDAGLSNMKTLIGKSGLSKDLRGPGQFTLFAPTNEAFEKMDPALRHRFMWENKCIDDVLRNHILGNVICSSAIQGRARSKNLLNNHLNLTRDADNKLFVDGAQVLIKDKMATNGVLYVIEDILIPKKAFDVLETAKMEGGSKFARLVKDADLMDDILSRPNITLFVPSDEAFQNLSAEALAALENTGDNLVKLVGYHVADKQTDCNGIRNNELIDTLNGRQLRYNEYSPHAIFRRNQRVRTIQCVPITNTDLEACGGNVNVINTLLLPPTGDVIDVLGQDSQFSTFIAYLKKTGLADELQKEGPFTVFAPTNEAFDKLGKRTQSKMEDDDWKLGKEILKNHIAVDVLCCAGVFKPRWFHKQNIRMASGKRLPLDMGQNKLPKVGSANFLSCDRTATNGVVHTIDNVLVNGERRRNRHRKQNDWFGSLFDFRGF